VLFRTIAWVCIVVVVLAVLGIIFI